MLKEFKNYFQDKKVLVTGNTGFKGSWLTQILLNLGASIIGFSNDIPTNPSLFKILELEKYIKNINGDVRNYKSFRNVILENNPDIIIHLAAQPLVRYSYIKPVETYQTNILGTVNLFESLRNLNHQNKIVLNVTTDKCYENKEKNYSYNESDPLGGHDPYSSSKACSEIVTSAYRRSFFSDNSLSIATARAGNVIGGGDFSQDRLVVDCIKALHNEEDIIIRNPTALRPWQHILEGLSGYLTLIKHMIQEKNDKNGIDYNSSWNFGPFEKDITDVEFLVKTLILYWGYGGYEVQNDNKFHEANLLKLDISKSLKYLDWKPLLNFDESLENTVQWYKEYYLNNGDMHDFTNKQIKEYFKKMK